METQPDEGKLLTLKLCIHGLFALVGGVVHEITHGRSPSLVRYVCGGFVGMFTGLVAYCICRHFNAGDWATAAVVALGGYTGGPLLDIGSRWLKLRAEKPGP